MDDIPLKQIKKFNVLDKIKKCDIVCCHFSISELTKPSHLVHPIAHTHSYIKLLMWLIPLTNRCSCTFSSNFNSNFYHLERKWPLDYLHT